VICCPKFSNNAQNLTNRFSHFVTHSTYPVTSPCTAIPGNLLWCCSRHSRVKVERNSRERAQQTTGASAKYFDLHHFWINVPQLFTFISGSLCSSVKIQNTLRCRRTNVRFSISGSSRLLCSNPHTSDLIQWRPNILFKDTSGSFFWGERLQKDTPTIAGYVAVLSWKNLSFWYK